LILLETLSTTTLKPASSKAFNFARDAMEFFKEGSDEDKKIALLEIDQNWTLHAGKLDMDARFPYQKIKEGMERTNKEFGTLEPKKIASKLARAGNKAPLAALENLW
jgi:hypothetical protein